MASPIMKELIKPYLELSGVDAAAMASLEGFLVASVGDSNAEEFEALAAHAASILSLAGELALEMGQRAPKLVTIDLGSRGMVLAPLNSEMFLMLAGDHKVLGLVRGSINPGI
jgi:predicted regulator of Ras-like GTPase activity (Roadblock/LC7/MglB family)